MRSDYENGRNAGEHPAGNGLARPTVHTMSHRGQPTASDEETRQRLHRSVRLLRDSWRLVLGSIVGVVTAVAAGIALSDPVYRATGTIEIRKQSAEVVPVDALFQFERISDQYLQTEYGTLRSRALLRRSLGDPQIALRLEQAGLLGVAGPVSDTAALLAKHAELMQGHLNVDPVVGSRIVRLSFDSPDPVLSADVVNALIAEYMAMRQEAGAAALVRISEQADSIRVHLIDAETELQQFVRQNQLSAVVAGGRAGETLPAERLRQLQQELTQAETEGFRTAALSNVADASGEGTLESDLLRTLRSRLAEIAGEYARARPTFTDSFPRMRQLRAELVQLDSLIALEEQRIGNSLRRDYQASLHRRDLLRAAVGDQRRYMDAFATTLAEYERRQRDIASLNQVYTTLQQKGKEAALTAGLAGTDVAVLDVASPPGVPVKPRPKRDIPLAAIVGLFLGVGVAFLRDYSDRTVRTPDELVPLSDVPLLGMIPAVQFRLRAHPALKSGVRRGEAVQRINAFTTPSQQLAEAFRGIRTSLLFAADGTLPRSLMVTSSAPGDGKTTISANFAISLGMLGYRVLLIDADMRRPTLHRLFGADVGPGLLDHLAGGHQWWEVVHRDVSPGVDLLAAGRNDFNPSDLLSAKGIQQCLREAASKYEFVVLDAPALSINVPDARILAHSVEGVLLVVRSGATPREVVGRIMLNTPNIVGVILNQVSPRHLPEYFAEYGGGTGVNADAAGSTGRGPAV